MSGNTERERQPETDAEFARDVDRRLDESEQPESARCGDWTISTEDGTGNLIACHVDGGCILIGEKPPAGVDPDGLHETPPEKIPEHKTPRIKVKGGAKSIGTGSLTTYDVWNTTVDYEEPPNTWTHDATNFTIPLDGDYLFIVFMPWTAVANGERSLEIRKNGTIVDLDLRPPATTARAQYNRIVETFRCVVGDVFHVRLFQDSGASVSAGGANFGDAWAQLSIVRLADADIIAHDAGTL